MAVLESGSLASNGLEAASATNDNAKEAEAELSSRVSAFTGGKDIEQSLVGFPYLILRSRQQIIWA